MRQNGEKERGKSGRSVNSRETLVLPTDRVRPYRIKPFSKRFPDRRYKQVHARTKDARDTVGRFNSWITRAEPMINQTLGCAT